MKQQYTFYVKRNAGQSNNERYDVTIDGLFMYKKNSTSFESAKEFAIEYSAGIQEFNECYGSFRIQMVYNEDTIYFADNSGMMRYFINIEEQHIYTSLLEALQEQNLRIPNYNAIAQYLCYGCTYDDSTIVESIVLSNPNKYYISQNGIILEKSKYLLGISEYDKDISLKRLIQQAITHCQGEIGCTITGGIDSRTVLANLIHIGINPFLAISGKEMQSDVIIAQKIADKLGTKCHVVHDRIEEKDWLGEAFIAADGREGICAVYRLNKFAKYLKKHNISLQFGGVNGEMYKNSFINQDFPFYFGRPNWKRFYKYKIATFDISEHICGDKLQKAIDELPNRMDKWLSSHKGTSKGDMYLSAGYEIMQSRCNVNINMISKYINIYNPLMERKMVASVFGKNPYGLEMQAFQRKEVTKLCPQIKNIETDRGLTCNFYRRQIEFINNYIYLVKVGFKRVFHRGEIDIRIDQSFEQGLREKRFVQAIDRLKEIGILDMRVDIETVPTRIADRLFTVGMIFANNANNDVNTNSFNASDD